MVNSFLKKIKEFENSVKDGDVLRGMPALKFPLVLEKDEFVDSEGDCWDIVIYLNSLSRFENERNVQASLSAHVSCRVSSIMAEKYGYSGERLKWLGMEEQVIQDEVWKTQVRTSVGKLEVLARKWVSLIIKKIDVPDKLAQKQMEFKRWLQSNSFTPFSQK